MMQIKPIISTVLLLICQCPIAADTFNPFQINQANNELKANASPSAFKTHQAQGAFPYDIPDDDPVGIDIPIELNGVNGNLLGLAITIDVEHSYIGDLEMTLTSPNGLAHLVLFSRVGVNNNSIYGYSSNLNGVYTFVDVDSNLGVTNDLWATALSNDNDLPEAAYRTSTEGKLNNNFGGCTTRLNGAFGGLTPAQSNGVWTLHVADHGFSDIGTINSVNFALAVATDAIFKSAFEPTTTTPYVPLPASDIAGNCKKAQYDFTGTGLSDYVTSWGYASELYVQVITNDGQPSDDNNFNSGLLFSTTVMTSGGDFDGDGIKDLVFKSPYSEELFQYLIRRSSRPDDLPLQVLVYKPLEEESMDLQIGDYDNDGLDDFAFFISNDNIGTQSKFLIFESSTFQSRQISTANGLSSDFRPSGGFDYNGDGVDDFRLFINNQQGNLHIIDYDGSNGQIIYNEDTGFFNEEYLNIPGTFLPNGQANIGTIFPFSGGNFQFSSWTTALFQTDVFYIGVSNEDIPITGDYDGDGIDDFGIWDFSEAKFIIRPSGSADPDNNLIEVQPNNSFSSDYPLANIRIR